jgi:hypothetical protein
LSNENHNKSTTDLIVAQITGNIARQRVGDYMITDWQAAGLVAPSVIRAKLATLQVQRVRRSLGTLPPQELAIVENKIRQALSL